VPAAHEKLETLQQILNGPDCKLALVFRRTTHRADKLARDLERRGYKVAALHGRRSQAQRERALGALRAGHLHALVATDIAARGLDITGLTHVVNFDLPDTAENYTHRVGRTARMGADGVAITLVSPEDEDALKTIQRKLSPAPARTTQQPRARQQQAPRQPARHPQPAGRHASPAMPSAPRPAGPPDGRRSAQHGAGGTPPRPARRADDPRRDGPSRANTNAPHSAPRHPAARERFADARPASGQRRPMAPRGRQEQAASDEGWYPFSMRRS
jgi:ATP-dependent RNA helicase RhlE